MLCSSITPIRFCLEFTKIQASYKIVIMTTRLGEIIQMGQFIKTTNLLKIQEHREIRHTALYHTNGF